MENRSQALEIIGDAELLVKKIGGTQAADVAGNLARTKTHSAEQDIVISAIRTEEFNTTSHLISAAEAISRCDRSKAGRELVTVKNFFHEAIRQLFDDNEAVHERFQAELTEFRAQLLAALHAGETIQQNGSDWSYKNFSITGFGEILTAALYETYFEDQEVDMSTVRIHPGYRPDLAHLRGYTDLHAAHIAKDHADAGRNPVLFIEKECALREADPREVPTAAVIPAIDRTLTTALCTSEEGPQAKLLHPGVLPLLADTDIQIVIGNPDRLETEGTTVTQTRTPNVVVRADTFVISHQEVPHTIATGTQGLRRRQTQSLAIAA